MLKINAILIGLKIIIRYGNPGVDLSYFTIRKTVTVHVPYVQG